RKKWQGGGSKEQAGQQSRARRTVELPASAAALPPSAVAGGPARSAVGPANSRLPRYTAALFTLHANALRYTATCTRSWPRTASFPIPCPLFNSELVASPPARHLCLSLNSAVVS